MKNNKYFALTDKGIISGSEEEVRREICGENVRTVHKIKGGIPVPVSVWEFTHKTEIENKEHCKSISDDLDKYADGFMVRCPGCGEIHDIENAGDYYKCPDCGEVFPVDEWESLSMYDYFDDFLDIDYIANYRKEYKACRVLVAYGGPNIYIDTYSGDVELYWWSDRASFPLRSDTISQIDEWAEEYFNMV